MSNLDRLLELARKATKGMTDDAWWDASGWETYPGLPEAAEYISAASPDAIIGLIERVKLAEARVKEAEKDRARWRYRFDKLEAKRDAAVRRLGKLTKFEEELLETRVKLEARLRAAEEVLRVVRDSGTWAPTEIVMALEAYDEAVGRVKE